MTDFVLKLADIPIRVKAIYESTKAYCVDYLTDCAPQLTVEITQEDLTRERSHSDKERALENLPPVRLPDAELEPNAVYRKIVELLADYNILLFHGSVVAVDGIAYLFTAKSGTGKSTHTRLWRKAFGKRAVMINDDKPLLKIANGQVMVCGTPWDGKHRLNTNCIVPLKAICILERGEENEIEAVSASQALPMLFQQSHRPANIAKYMDLINEITASLPFYRLRCNMDLSAAEIAYEAMK